MTEPGTSAQDALRNEILAAGHNDFVCMAAVQAIISEDRLADTGPACQQPVVDTVRSLLVDGLVHVGEIPGPDDPGFKAWPGTVDEVMTRFIDRFVTHHDDRHGWRYTIWLNLTAEGKPVSSEIFLRKKILESGQDDVVSMDDVQDIIWGHDLADSVAERQQLIADAIRSLLMDRLVEVGEIPGRNDPGFRSWPGIADEVMTWFTDRFVEHYDDRRQWDTIRLNLTAKGKQASNDLV